MMLGGNSSHNDQDHDHDVEGDHGPDRSGLGLGLSISRRAVEACGGTLRVRNVPGVGCVFTVDLPLDLPRDGAPVIPDPIKKLTPVV